ncbi:MAG TPA: hypothetical protein VEX18_20170, partial [Polyangiaceae bacterium]|nr:hypothetical protein [Polyangiaceae bacterium]
MTDPSLKNAVYWDASQTPERRTSDLLSRMTLAEKVGQMLQFDGQFEPIKMIREMQPASLFHILNERLA